tara:strand:+ start:3024 stop:3731 length:708 start_codon:yes stop_codon:yes gene_type:complete
MTWFDILKAWTGGEELAAMETICKAIDWPYETFHYDTVPTNIPIYGGKNAGSTPSITIDNMQIVEFYKEGWNQLSPEWKKRMRGSKHLSGRHFKNLDTPVILGYKSYIVAPNQVVTIATKNGRPQKKHLSHSITKAVDSIGAAAGQFKSNMTRLKARYMEMVISELLYTEIVSNPKLSVSTKQWIENINFDDTNNMDELMQTLDVKDAPPGGLKALKKVIELVRVKDKEMEDDWY